MDAMLESLKSGSAFTRQTSRRKRKGKKDEEKEEEELTGCKSLFFFFPFQVVVSPLSLSLFQIAISASDLLAQLSMDE